MVATQSFKATKEGSVLRINGNSGASVEDVSKYLKALDYAYNSAYVFNNIVKQAEELNNTYNRSLPIPLRNLLWLNWWNPNEEKIASFVPLKYRLTLEKVNINSPGFWEFVGALNPLQFIREYLKDNHERKKDRKYREEDEEKLADLQIQLKEIEVIEKKAKLLKELSATEEDIDILISELLAKPLKELSSFQDTNLIIDAEIVDPNENRTIPTYKLPTAPYRRISVPISKPLKLSSIQEGFFDFDKIEEDLRQIKEDIKIKDGKVIEQFLTLEKQKNSKIHIKFQTTFLKDDRRSTSYLEFEVKEMINVPLAILEKFELEERVKIPLK
jgi:hypothetical protein